MTDQNDRHDENESQDDVEALVRELERGEAPRRRLALLGGVLALGTVAVLLWAMTAHRDTMFRPELGIEDGEQALLEETNDPACRNMIGEVTTGAKKFFESERAIERDLLARELPRSEAVHARLVEIGDDVQRARELSEQAVLRYDHSREELERWFAYVDGELALLQRLGREHRERLEADQTVEADEANDQAGEDQAGDVQGHVVRPADGALGAKTDRKAGSGAPPAPEELRDRALLAVHESFQSFRVWHSASMHPCGRAPEGVTPWHP